MCITKKRSDCLKDNYHLVVIYVRFRISSVPTFTGISSVPTFTRVLWPTHRSTVEELSFTLDHRYTDTVIIKYVRLSDTNQVPGYIPNEPHKPGRKVLLIFKEFYVKENLIKIG